jgi:hypothetical protein
MNVGFGGVCGGACISETEFDEDTRLCKFSEEYAGTIGGALRSAVTSFSP